jgi:hypothetical protein
MRTEEDKVTQAPVIAILGGTEYEIKPLVIAESRQWRREVGKLFGDMPGLLKQEGTEDEVVATALSIFFQQMPDTVIDLFFGYAKDLDREAIEMVATEAEIAVAFRDIMEVAFPLANTLTEAMGTAATAAAGNHPQ